MTANRIKATPEQAVALMRRQMTDRANIVRGRIEAMDGCGLLPKISAVENRMRLLQFGVAKDMLDEIDEKLEDLRHSRAAAEVADASRKQDALLAERGVDTVRTVTGVGSRHGFHWLVQKGRLSPSRRDAGSDWSRDYCLAKADSLRSCLNDNAPGSGQVPENMQQDQKADAYARLDHGRAHVVYATGNGRLADLLDAVCGRGETVRGLAGGDQYRAVGLEAELMIALDLAAVAYGVRKT